MQEDIRFGTNNGTEAMRIHNTQRVVIGPSTSSASANNLTLSGTGTELDFYKHIW